MTEYMTNRVRLWSIISGISLLVMAVAAGAAYGYIFNLIYVDANQPATTANIQSNEMLYLTGSLLWCLILLTDLAVSYGFFKFLATIRRTNAITSGLLRLIYSIILAVGIIHMFQGNPWNFLYFWSVGLFIFGFHLIVTGFTLLYGTKLLKILGILLIIAGSGYCIVHGIQSFFPQAEAIAEGVENILRIPMTAAELLFGIWLLFRGGRKVNRQSSDRFSQAAV